MMPPMPHTVSGDTGCGLAVGSWMNLTRTSVSAGLGSPGGGYCVACASVALHASSSTPRKREAFVRMANPLVMGDRGVKAAQDGVRLVRAMPPCANGAC